MNIIVSSAPMRLNPDFKSSLETECLFGEKIKVLEIVSEWAYCELLTDNYYGWIKKSSIGKLDKITHRIISKRSFVLSDANEKSFCITYLPMGSNIHVKKISHNWAELTLPSSFKFSKGYILTRDIIAINDKFKNWVKFAEQLINTPYKWGGRDSLGIDCSALLQLSYQNYGENIPRNSSEQSMLNKIKIIKLKELERGCVIFWKGHVGIMVDKLNCIHANAFHMMTTIEPLSEIISRMGSENKITKMMNFNTSYKT